MKPIIFLTIFLLICLAKAKSQDSIVPVYNKTIYDSPSKLDDGVTYNEITILAESSSKFEVEINKRSSLQAVQSGNSESKSISFNNTTFEKYVNAMKKYLDWHKIVEQNNVSVTKNIDSINIYNNNISCCFYPDFKSKFISNLVYKNYTKLVFEFNDNDFVLKATGGYRIYKLIDEKKETKDFVISFNKAEIEQIYLLLTGVSFQNIKNEIDSKIKVWDQLK